MEDSKKLMTRAEELGFLGRWAEVRQENSVSSHIAIPRSQEHDGQVCDTREDGTVPSRSLRDRSAWETEHSPTASHPASEGP